MYMERVPNRNSPPAVLLRESYREGDQVKKRTLANLSTLPDEVIDNMKLVLKGAKVSMTETIPDNFEVIRSRPHGHVMVILETIKKCGMHRRFPAGFRIQQGRRLGLDKIIAKTPSRTRKLVLGMIIARIINPKSKLATARGFHEKTLSNSLGKRKNSNSLWTTL